MRCRHLLAMGAIDHVLGLGREAIKHAIDILIVRDVASEFELALPKADSSWAKGIKSFLHYNFGYVSGVTSSDVSSEALRAALIQLLDDLLAGFAHIDYDYDCLGPTRQYAD